MKEDSIGVFQSKMCGRQNYFKSFGDNNTKNTAKDQTSREKINI